MRRALSLVAVGILVSGGAGRAAEAPGAESPQAVVERMSAAADSENFAELAACIDPASREEMAAGLIMATTMMVAFAGFGGAMAGEIAEGMAEAFGEEGSAEPAEAEAPNAEAEIEALNQSYRAVLAKHGLERMMDEEPSDETDLDALMADVDQVALIADLMAFMQSFPGSESSSDEVMPRASDITGYEIHGDHATAQGPDGPIEFVKVDGRWYFKADAGDDDGGDDG